MAGGPGGDLGTGSSRGWPRAAAQRCARRDDPGGREGGGRVGGGTRGGGGACQGSSGRSRRGTLRDAREAAGSGRAGPGRAGPACSQCSQRDTRATIRDAPAGPGPDAAVRGEAGAAGATRLALGRPGPRRRARAGAGHVTGHVGAPTCRGSPEGGGGREGRGSRRRARSTALMDGRCPPHHGTGSAHQGRCPPRASTPGSIDPTPIKVSIDALIDADRVAARGPDVPSLHERAIGADPSPPWVHAARAATEGTATRGGEGWGGNREARSPPGGIGGCAVDRAERERGGRRGGGEDPVPTPRSRTRALRPPRPRPLRPPPRASPPAPGSPAPASPARPGRRLLPRTPHCPPARRCAPAPRRAETGQTKGG